MNHIVKDGAIIAHFKVIVAVTCQTQTCVREDNVGKYKIRRRIHRSNMKDVHKGGKSSNCKGERNMSC